ncbi:MAG: PLP-dependent transferase, partial [Saprospiraceae bacterium]|nr:PLP-dependent transferase [Saprospiraceae bacterium]
MKYSIDTLCVQQNKEKRSTQPHVLPLYATSSFAMDNLEEGIEIFSGQRKGHVYGRYGNPTIDTVAAKIAAMESFGCDFEAAALFTSSGMSAISTLFLGLLKHGEALLTQGNLYGGTTELLLKILEPQGIEVVFQDLKKLDEVESLLKAKKNIRLIFGETPANPTMACVDLEALATLGKKYEVLTAVDNTFASPYLQRPL